MALKKEIERPKVGLGVYIIKDGKVLLTKRIGSHGANTWCPPGGHLELGESFEECAVRETLEEVGIKIKNTIFIGTTNDIYEKDLHYVTMGMRADLASGEPKIMEPDKCKDIGWYDLDNLPSPLFLPVKHFLKDFKEDLLHKKEEIIYNKLIRDRIPEITKADGWTSVTRKLNHKEYILELRKKILEEAKELNEGSGRDNLVEELVDLQEIIDAILAADKIDKKEFKKIQDAKRNKRGGFEKKLFLIKTIKEDK